MSAIIDVLLASGYVVTEEDVAAWLTKYLPPKSDSVPPTGLDEFLRAHSGITGRRPNPAAVVSELTERLADMLTTSEVAERLRVDRTRVQHLLRARDLYAVKVNGHNCYPSWQFTGTGRLPELHLVLEALPADLDALEVDGFMTSPQADLIDGGEQVSPAQWLASGRPATVVAELAQQVGQSWW